jgi:hypothetical protein
MDGTSMTIMLAEAADPVIWTKPEDTTFDGKQLPRFGGVVKNGFNVALADGSVLFVRQNVRPNHLRGALTRNGGEVLPNEWYEQAVAQAAPGAVTILIDLSASMNVNIPGSKSLKFEELQSGLSRVLDDLPRGTALTVAAFWGDPGAVHVEPIAGATRVAWQGNAAQKQQVFQAIASRRPVSTGNTPLARSIREVLSRDRGKAFWPDNVGGVRTLLVLTDGGDENLNKGEQPADIVLGSLNDPAAPETALHIIFFSVPPAEEALLAKQYQPLVDPASYRVSGRRPAQLHQRVQTASALGDRVREALSWVEPRPGDAVRVTGKVTYRGQPLAGGWVTFNYEGPGQKEGVGVTMRPDGTYDVATGLEPGRYRVAIVPPKDPAGRSTFPAIPSRYTDMNTSDLTVEVKPGGQMFDIDLTDAPAMKQQQTPGSGTKSTGKGG